MCIDVYDIRRKDSFPWSYETPLWSIGLPMIMGVTYREGGESLPPYDTLNLAFHVGDYPADVLENRSIVADHLGVSPDRITCGNQVHGLNWCWLYEF